MTRRDQEKSISGVRGPGAQNSSFVRGGRGKNCQETACVHQDLTRGLGSEGQALHLARDNERSKKLKERDTLSLQEKTRRIKKPKALDLQGLLIRAKPRDYIGGLIERPLWSSMVNSSQSRESLYTLH
jgi:hypothetical protein